MKITALMSRWFWKRKRPYEHTTYSCQIRTHSHHIPTYTSIFWFILYIFIRVSITGKQKHLATKTSLIPFLVNWILFDTTKRPWPQNGQL